MSWSPLHIKYRMTLAWQTTTAISSSSDVGFARLTNFRKPASMAGASLNSVQGCGGYRANGGSGTAGQPSLIRSELLKNKSEWKQDFRKISNRSSIFTNSLDLCWNLNNHKKKFSKTFTSTGERHSVSIFYNIKILQFEV